MESKLAAGAIYVGDNGRMMCAAMTCAGATATVSGRDLSGQRVRRTEVEDVAVWGTFDLGSMTCECGSVTLTAVAGPDGFPLAQATVTS